MPFFSPTTVGFYDPEIHSVIPDDAIEITAETYDSLMAGQSSGQRIVVGEDGAPSLAAPAELTDDEKLASVKAERANAWLLPITQTADVAGLLKNVVAFCEYRSDIRAIFMSPTASPNWPTAPAPIWA
jgi:hypothetical protein